MAHSPIFQRFGCLYQCKRSVFDALSPSLLDVVIRSTIPESPQFSSGLTMRKHSTGKYSRDFLRFFRVKISLCLSPLLHINKKARLLRMRNPLTYSHPLRSGLSRRIICKYCRTSQRLGWIGHLYYKEDCSPCRTQTGTEKVASPCVRPLVWWRLVFSGVLERLQTIRKR